MRSSVKLGVILAMVDKGAVAGRNVFVDGPREGAEVAALVARALGMPSTAVLTDASTIEEENASWSDSGWVRVARLEPGSEFRFHLDIVLYRKTMDLSVFPAMARQHGLTVAWDANDEAEHDWHFHIA